MGSSHFVGDAQGDQPLNMWFLTYVPFAVLHGHSLVFTSYLNVPYGVNLMAQTSVELLGALVAPVTLLFGPVAGLTAATAACPALSAVAAWLLLRRLVDSPLAAFAGGLLYGFSPYEISQLWAGHLNLAFVPLPPLMVLLVHELFVRQRWRAGRTGAALGAVVAAQVLVSTEVLATTAIVLAAGGAVLAWLSRADLRPRARHALVGTAAAVAVGSALGGYPVWFALEGAQHIVGPTQVVPQSYRADLISLVAPGELQWLTTAPLRHFARYFSGGPAEDGSYLGLPLVAVVVAGALRYRRHRLVAAVAAAGAVSFVLSLGASLVVRASPLTAPGRLPLPERLLGRAGPMRNVIPSRFALYVALSAAVILAFIIERIERERTGTRPGTRRLAAVLVVAVTLVPLVPAIPFAAAGNATAPRQALELVPAGSVALLYPYPTAVTQGSQEWQALTFMRFRMPGGYAIVPAGKVSTVPVRSDVTTTRSTTVGDTLTALAQGTVPLRTAALRAAVRQELTSWRVDSIVADSSAVSFAAAESFLAWVVGVPPVQVGTAVAWYHLARVGL